MLIKPSAKTLQALLETSVAISAVITLGALCRRDGYAAPPACATNLVTNMQGVTCVIGDLQFTFGTYNQSSGPPPWRLFFTPNATNVRSPGFNLSAAPTFELKASGATGTTHIDGAWPFTVATVSGRPTIRGATLNIRNPQWHWGGSDSDDAFAAMSLVLCGVTVSARWGQNSPQPGGQNPVSKSFNGVTRCTATATWTLHASGGANYAQADLFDVNVNH